MPSNLGAGFLDFEAASSSAYVARSVAMPAARRPGRTGTAARPLSFPGGSNGRSLPSFLALLISFQRRPMAPPADLVDGSRHALSVG